MLTPAADAVMAAIPTTRQGVAAILDLAVQIRSWDTELDSLIDRLVEIARDALSYQAVRQG